MLATTGRPAPGRSLETLGRWHRWQLSERQSHLRAEHLCPGNFRLSAFRCIGVCTPIFINSGQMQKQEGHGRNFPHLPSNLPVQFLGSGVDKGKEDSAYRLNKLRKGWGVSQKYQERYLRAPHPQSWSSLYLRGSRDQKEGATLPLTQALHASSKASKNAQEQKSVTPDVGSSARRVSAGTRGEDSGLTPGAALRVPLWSH